MDVLGLLSKAVGALIIFILVATVIYRLLGGRSLTEDVAAYGRVQTSDETWSGLRLGPLSGATLGCLVMLIAALVTFIIVFIWLRWF